MFDSPRGKRNIFPSPTQTSSPSFWQCIWSYGQYRTPWPHWGLGVSVTAPLPERLPGLLQGSPRPQSSFEFSVSGRNSSWNQPKKVGLNSIPPLVYGQGDATKAEQLTIFYLASTVSGGSSYILIWRRPRKLFRTYHLPSRNLM